MIVEAVVPFSTWSSEFKAETMAAIMAHTIQTALATPTNILETSTTTTDIISAATILAHTALQTLPFIVTTTPTNIAPMTAIILTLCLSPIMTITLQRDTVNTLEAMVPSKRVTSSPDATQGVIANPGVLEVQVRRMMINSLLAPHKKVLESYSMSVRNGPGLVAVYPNKPFRTSGVGVNVGSMSS